MIQPAAKPFGHPSGASALSNQSGGFRLRHGSAMFL